jgi:hypothetical protein
LQNRLAPQRTALASASPMAAANRPRWLHERVMARPLWANLWGPGRRWRERSPLPQPDARRQAHRTRRQCHGQADGSKAGINEASSPHWLHHAQAPTRSTAVHHFRRCKPPWAMPTCRPRVAIRTRGAVSFRSLWVHAIRDPSRNFQSETTWTDRLAHENLIYGTRLEFYSSDARARVCAGQT